MTITENIDALVRTDLDICNLYVCQYYAKTEFSPSKLLEFKRGVERIIIRRRGYDECYLEGQSESIHRARKDTYRMQEAWEKAPSDRLPNSLIFVTPSDGSWLNIVKMRKGEEPVHFDEASYEGRIFIKPEDEDISIGFFALCVALRLSQLETFYLSEFIENLVSLNDNDQETIELISLILIEYEEEIGLKKCQLTQTLVNQQLDTKNKMNQENQEPQEPKTFTLPHKCIAMYYLLIKAGLWNDSDHDDKKKKTAVINLIHKTCGGSRDNIRKWLNDGTERNNFQKQKSLVWEYLEPIADDDLRDLVLIKTR